MVSEEEAKPDFLDLDKDGDKEESMKSAAEELDEMHGHPGKCCDMAHPDEAHEDYMDRITIRLSEDGKESMSGSKTKGASGNEGKPKPPTPEETLKKAKEGTLHTGTHGMPTGGSSGVVDDKSVSINLEEDDDKPAPKKKETKEDPKTDTEESGDDKKKVKKSNFEDSGVEHEDIYHQKTVKEATKKGDLKMRITKTQLRQIIKEELSSVLQMLEGDDDKIEPGDEPAPADVDLEDVYKDVEATGTKAELGDAGASGEEIETFKKTGTRPGERRGRPGSASGGTGPAS